MSNRINNQFMEKKILFYLLILVTLLSCVKDAISPNYQLGEAPLKAAGSVANDFVVSGIPRDIVNEYDIDTNYYTKYTSVWGIPIVASDEIDNIFLKNTAELVGFMLSDESLISEKATQIRNLLYKNRLRIAVFPDNKRGTKQLPEFKNLSSAFAYGATKEVPVIGFNVFDVTECPDRLSSDDSGRRKQGSTLVHELMNSIHDFALEKIFDDFNDKLNKSYQNAKYKKSLNKQYSHKITYLSDSCEKYLAEGAEVWFNWQPYSYDYNLFFPKHSDLKNIDPDLYNVLSLIFQQNPNVMNNLSFASPKVFFYFKDLNSMFGNDYSDLRIKLYGDNKLIRTCEVYKSDMSRSFIIPDPRVSYISFDNYRFEVTIFYNNSDPLVKEYILSKEELIAIDGFPSNVNLKGALFNKK